MKADFHVCCKITNEDVMHSFVATLWNSGVVMYYFITSILISHSLHIEMVFLL